MDKNAAPSGNSAYLKPLIPLARTLAEMFGSRCEIVIHEIPDQQTMDSTIVAVEGNVTGRVTGGPPTDYLLQRIRSSGRSGDSLVYPGQTATGRPLRSSTTLIRDPSGNLVGVFCINYDMTDLLTMRGILDGLCLQQQSNDHPATPLETFAKDPDQTFDSILQAAVRAVGKPVEYMGKPERIRLVRHVEENGGFLMRGAVDRVAKHIGVTRCTVYNYLSEVKRSDSAAQRPDAE